jgi:hypothetical protein
MKLFQYSLSLFCLIVTISVCCDNVFSELRDESEQTNDAKQFEIEGFVFLGDHFIPITGYENIIKDNPHYEDEFKDKNININYI